MKITIYEDFVEKNDRNFFYIIRGRRLRVYAVKTAKKRPIHIATVEAPYVGKEAAKRALVKLYGFKLNASGCLPKEVQLYELEVRND